MYHSSFYLPLVQFHSHNNTNHQPAYIAKNKDGFTFQYDLDFDKMIQTNNLISRTRPIRRQLSDLDVSTIWQVSDSTEWITIDAQISQYIEALYQHSLSPSTSPIPPSQTNFPSTSFQLSNMVDTTSTHQQPFYHATNKDGFSFQYFVNFSTMTQTNAITHVSRQLIRVLSTEWKVQCDDNTWFSIGYAASRNVELLYQNFIGFARTSTTTTTTTMSDNYDNESTDLELFFRHNYSHLKPIGKFSLYNVQTPLNDWIDQQFHLIPSLYSIQTYFPPITFASPPQELFEKTYATLVPLSPQEYHDLLLEPSKDYQLITSSTNNTTSTTTTTSTRTTTTTTTSVSMCDDDDSPCCSICFLPLWDKTIDHEYPTDTIAKLPLCSYQHSFHRDCFHLANSKCPFRCSTISPSHGSQLLNGTCTLSFSSNSCVGYDGASIVMKFSFNSFSQANQDTIEQTNYIPVDQAVPTITLLKLYLKAFFLGKLYTDDNEHYIYCKTSQTDYNSSDETYVKSLFGQFDEAGVKLSLKQQGM